MALLRILSGDNKGKIHEISDEKLVVGRDSEQIPVLDQGVSRKHAELFRIGEMVFIRDLGSRNGTFVNDNRINGVHTLQNGDMIVLGKHALRYERSGPDATSLRSERRPRGQYDPVATQTIPQLDGLVSPSTLGMGLTVSLVPFLPKPATTKAEGATKDSRR